MTSDAIREARRLHAAGKHTEARDLLVNQIYDQGLSDDVLTELQRLFPAEPELLEMLEDYDARMEDADPKTRQKAAKELSRLALGVLSNNAFHFLRHPETITLLIRQLDNPDVVVQENMTIALAMAFQRYTRDMRAFEPLIEKLKSKTINTRGWAAIGLVDLTDDAVEHVLPLVNDKAERVWKAVMDELIIAVRGGGILSRPPMGVAGRRKIRDWLLAADRKREANFRISAAVLLAMTAEPRDIPALQEWIKKDGSKVVKQLLREGVDRLQKEPPAPASSEPAQPALTAEQKSAAMKKPASKGKAPGKKNTAKAATKRAKTKPPSKQQVDPGFAPCRFLESTDGGLHSLMFNDFDSVADVFDGMDRDGGGYDWHAVVDALVRTQAPKLKGRLQYDPEASMLVVLSSDKEALKQVAQLIRAALADEALLKKAIKKADPNIG